MSCIALVALVVGTLLLAGCDGGGSRRASMYQRLVGSWTPERLRAGPADATTQLRQRYDTVRIDFDIAGDGARSFRLLGFRSSDTLRVEGPVTVPGAGVLRMEQGFGRPVTWTFDFGELSNSVTLHLPPTRQAGSTAFLRTVLPGRSWADAQRVRLDLLRASSDEMTTTLSKHP